MCDVLLLDTSAHVAPPTAPLVEEILLGGKILRNMAFWARTGIKPRPTKVFTRGLLTIGAALRKAGFTVDYDACVLDSFGELPERILRKIKGARVVGVSSITPAQPIADRIYRIIARENPTAMIVAGGYHPTAMPQEVLAANPDLDLIVRGEGEATMVELLQKNCVPEGIRGVVYRTKEGEAQVEPPRPRLCPEEFPPADYSLLPGDLSDYDFNVSSMRGCSYRCSFCSNWSFWGKPRYHPIEMVINELRYLDRHLPAGTLVHFTDNVFSEDWSRTMELCKRIQAERVGLLFSADIRAGTVDAVLLKEMEAAGFRHVAIGFEDDDATILDRVKKDVKSESNRETACLIRSCTNMAITAYWMVGLPGTTIESVYRNLFAAKQLIKEDIVDIVSARIFVPYPGTAIFHRPDRFGVEIVDTAWERYDRVTSLPIYRMEQVGRYELYAHYLALRASLNEAYRRKLGIPSDRLEAAIRRARDMGEWAYS
jgi:anaerobic magnesium-protoporphyrin IX monomethyl ester cyclase